MLETLALPPDSRAWYIGDSYVDMLTAHRAGICGVFFNGAGWEPERIDSWFTRRDAPAAILDGPAVPSASGVKYDGLAAGYQIAALQSSLPSYGTGRDVATPLRFRPLIFSRNATGLSLTGGGVVDGQGETWWLKHFARRLRWSRPRLVECMYCDGLLIEDLTFRNSPFWTVHPYMSQDVHIHHVNITDASPADAHFNTDGIDPDS